MRTVLVTGGSRGIGKAIVKAFSAAGYSVAFTYKNSSEEASELSRECSALAIRADSELESDILSAVDLTLRELGHIDVLINNAAISSFSLFTDISLDEWNKIFAVNVSAPFLYTKAVLPNMISRKSGRIINISSMWGLVGSSCEVHYSATKAALIGMTKALAKELGPSGITVNAIAPGLINTDMNASLPAEDLTAIAEETPLGRMGEADDVARAALFLAGNGASFITGDVMNISGGYVV